MTTPISAADPATTSSVQATKHHRHDLPARVADKLGMSTDDLRNQLRGDKTLNDLAAEKGLSHDDLIAAIKQGGTTSDADAEKIASAAGTPPPRAKGAHHGGHHAKAAAPKGENSGLQDDDKLDQVSQLLQMSTGDVSGQATSASGLVNLFQHKGVDLGSLKNVLDNGDLLDVAA
ncbi:hypothetical protein [Actinoplanes subtropicus]|uniref:hypothetical protein n=1 Tax=Actinoplanes subtropicus TaxID=543632 RepID=UPI0004C3D10F|nr:hypothetical protein [Actinoplanes subtropicus]